MTAPDPFLRDACPKTPKDVEDVKAYIKASKDLPPAPPRKALPQTSHTASPQQRLQAIQQYITSLEYNHTGVCYFNVCKTRPLHSILATAKAIVYDSLPIKCIEASFLGIYLTQGMTDIDRIPLAFKSIINGQVFKHIVLAVHSGGKFGCLGLSRRQTLMYKPLTYPTLSDLVEEFLTCYEKCYHKVVRVRIGLPISHHDYTAVPILWRCLRLNLENPNLDVAASCDRYFSCIRTISSKWNAGGSKRPDCSRYMMDCRTGQPIAQARRSLPHVVSTDNTTVSSRKAKLRKRKKSQKSGKVVGQSKGSGLETNEDEDGGKPLHDGLSSGQDDSGDESDESSCSSGGESDTSESDNEGDVRAPICDETVEFDSGENVEVSSSEASRDNKDDDNNENLIR